MQEHTQRKHQYQNNFLSDVIFRIDFLENKVLVNNIEEIKQRLTEKYPKFEKVIIKKLAINKNSDEAKIDSDFAAKFSSDDGKTIVNIDHSFISLVEKDYYSHSKFKSKIEELITILQDFEQDLKIKRCGFRYINQIRLNQKNPYDLKKYISKNLLGIFNFNPSNNTIIRSMNSTEFLIDDDTRLIFQYGLYNKHYPSKPLQKEFILDYDCFTISTEKLIDTINFFDTNNKKVAIFFESSIDEKLRKELDEQKKE